MLPSGSMKTLFAVDSPAVGSPNERVLGRPRNEIATASPELAVRGPVSTATYAESSAASAGVGLTSTHALARQSGALPPALTNDPRPTSPSNGRRPPSMGHMLPPPLLRRSTTHLHPARGNADASESCTSFA